LHNDDHNLRLGHDKHMTGACIEEVARLARTRIRVGAMISELT
jgi:hypothetical protein